MAFGTLFSLDAQAEVGNTTVQEIGEDRLWENLDAYFAAHTILFNQAAEMVAERTTDRLRRYGDVDDIEAQELDEFGQPSAQKMGVDGYNIGFPGRRFGNALQWTRTYFENMTVDEFARQVNAIADADEVNLYRSLRRAIFTPTNTTFVDWWEMPKVDLPVKALLNADSAPVPIGPYGTTFNAASHTHYHGVATGGTPLQTEVVALIEDVTEHFVSGAARLYINRAEEAKVRAFTDFVPYLDARLINQEEAIIARGTANVTNHYDRAIGLLESAEVWVKPWIPAGYMLAYLEGPDKPVVMREPIPQSQRMLRIVAQDENHPLRATEWEHRFGFGVWNRANGAVLDTVTGSSTYSAPAIA